MARIATSDVHAALRRAADHLIEAAGCDLRVSRDDVKAKLATLQGTERMLVDLFFRFIDHRDFQPGATVTVTDVEDAYAYAIEHLIDAYDLDGDGLSGDEVAKMSQLGKLAVALAFELYVPPEPIQAEPLVIDAFDPTLTEIQLRTLTSGLSLLSESEAALKPIVVPMAPSAALDVHTVRRLFADVHTDLGYDIFGYQRAEVFDLAQAYGEERDFGEWFVQRRMPEDLGDPLAVELAVRTGELIDFLVANVPAPRVFAYSDRTNPTGHPIGAVSVFIVGRTPDGWLLGVYSASLEG